jgi:hypothetical protein
MVISITKAEYISDYKIKFYFSDETEKIIDFEGFLSTSKNPMTRKYLDLNLFQDFQLEYGDIVWNNFDLCFPIWDLYEGKV